MGDYNRTIWKDHIKDQNGSVIQQGTPVSAKNLNNIENQIVALSAKENVLAELVKETIPSGFTTLSDLDYTSMATNPNTIKLVKDSVAYVNGYKITIPAGTVINLDVPPTSGSREDLVFLEAWKQADANGTEQLSWRIRVVDGVDFTTYSEGISNTSLVKARGGQTSDTSYTFSKSSTDAGIYISGSGSANDKTALNTTDGYVYAIPMFRIHRRNSGGYSVNNGNGAKTYLSFSTLTSSTAIVQGGMYTMTVQSSASFSVGDILNNATATWFKVLSIIDSTHISVLSYQSSSSLSYTGLFRCDRNDKLIADITVDRDIIDLRHQVSLTGFNYQQLLEENFDKLLRGELQTNSKTNMLKTYHGIPKTPIDANHVFYYSGDTPSSAEVGSNYVNTYPAYLFGNAPTGQGVQMLSDGGNGLSLNLPAIPIGTLDMWIYSNGTTGGYLYSGSNNLREYIGTTLNVSRANFFQDKGKWYHHRVTWNTTTQTINYYMNGKLVTTRSFSDGVLGISSTGFSNAFTLGILTSSSNSQTYTDILDGYRICDIAISNIDRGAVFATLPQDFIDGYARIDKAFNTQRNVFSDALTSESPLAQVHCAGGNNKEVTINVASSSKWTAGDTVKVKGLGGEIITGVIDSDTALTKVVATNNNSNQLYVDDVSKLSVGDTFNIYDTLLLQMSTLSRTVTAIDTTNRIVTMDGSTFNSGYGQILVETTTSSSAPTVKANLTGTAQAGASSTITLASGSSATDSTYNGLTITITGGTGVGQVRTIGGYVGSTKVATVSSAWGTTPDATSTYLITGTTVSGTWINLGTNEATFTVGTVYITNQDLLINYSLNEVAGQCGIGEVLTTTLAGESNSKKLTVNPIVHVRDDFAGKVTGSTIVNPNISKETISTTLQSPSGSWVQEFVNNGSGIPKLDGICYNTSTTTNADNGKIAQQLFSFNLIRIVEDKYGTLPCAPDTASKIVWLKSNISNITFNWWGYGSGPNGNKAYEKVYDTNANTWAGSQSNNSTTPTKISEPDTGITSRIDINGFVHYLVYTDASNGVIPSSIYTDYVNFEIVLNAPTGYDVLAPENPRRDDGKSNILLVRKETKEIQTMFPRSNSDWIVTYGDYIPYQGLGDKYGKTFNVNKISDWMLLTTNGTGGVIKLSNGRGFTPPLDIIKNLPIASNLKDYNYCKDNILTDIPPYINNPCSLIDSLSTYRPVIQKGGTSSVLIPSSIYLDYGFTNVPLTRGSFNAIVNWFNGFKSLLSNISNVNYIQVLPMLISNSFGLFLLVITHGKTDGFIGTNPYTVDNAGLNSLAIDVFKVDKNLLIK